MSKTIFFSWQLDSESRLNKKFIWEAICKACNELCHDSSPELSPRPESDTMGISGTPNIVQSIFNKIENCSVFIADLTFVGATESGKRIPNPNVLLELGFAVKTIGWDRTILVLNESMGSAKDLPFDLLQHRWPISYNLTENSKVLEGKSNKLMESISFALTQCELSVLERAKRMMALLDTNSLSIISKNEHNNYIDMYMPPRTMGEHMADMVRNDAYKRLIDLGALEVTNTPELGYRWTTDGIELIRYINIVNPEILTTFRNNSNNTIK